MFQGIFYWAHREEVDKVFEIICLVQFGNDFLVIERIYVLKWDFERWYDGMIQLIESFVVIHDFDKLLESKTAESRDVIIFWMTLHQLSPQICIDFFFSFIYFIASDRLKVKFLVDTATEKVTAKTSSVCSD